MQKDFAKKSKDLNQFQIQNPFFLKRLQILLNPLKKGFKSFKSKSSKDLTPTLVSGHIRAASQDHWD